MLAGVVLVAAGVASGVTAALTHGSSPVSTSVTPPTQATGVASSALNVSAIASHIDPSVVDVTSRLSQSDTAAGTGMVVSPSGLVVTNNHVIAGATSISVTIGTSTVSHPATVVGTDPSADIAVIQVHGVSGLPTMPLGDSSSVTLGQPVVAIGNAFDLQGPPTVTQGTVTALDRSVTAGDSTGQAEQLQGLIQTSASLSPGNSGGPLVNGSGQVVGMDTAAATGSSFQSPSNVGFAIPINQVRSVASQIESGQASSTVQIGQRGFLGIAVGALDAQGPIGSGGSPSGGFGGYGGFGGNGSYGGYGGGGSVAPVSSGALVLQVASSSPASSIGLVAGDVIVSVDGKAVGSPQALTALLLGHHPGDTVTIGWVDQGGQHHSAAVKLVAGPAA